MVVVPAFAAADQGDPPVVARVVASFKAARTPEMRGRVDEPGGVEAERYAEENSPEQPAEGIDGATEEPADGGEKHAAGGEWDPMILAEPDVEAVAGEIGRVAIENFGLRVQGVAEEEPAGVGPPAAFTRGVRVAFVVAVLVVDAMRRDPEHRAAFEGQGGAGSHEVFKPFGNLVAAVGEQTVVAHADADIDGHHVHDEHYREPLPTEEEESCYRAHMKDSNH